MAKILVVEDEQQLCLTIVQWLTEEGHEVESCETGKDAMQMLNSFKFEIIVLDWSLPEISGQELLKQYRDAGGDAQVLMLTGKTDLESKTLGLDSGADDYITKPFELRELGARIRSRLRRTGQFKPLTVSIEGVIINTNDKTVVAHGQQVYFSSREFSVIEFLLRHRGLSFSARALRENIWPSQSEILDDTVRVCIQSIRRKLGAIPGGLIKSTAGQGYSISSADDL